MRAKASGMASVGRTLVVMNTSARLTPDARNASPFSFFIAVMIGGVEVAIAELQRRRHGRDSGFAGQGHGADANLRI